MSDFSIRGVVAAALLAGACAAPVAWAQQPGAATDVLATTPAGPVTRADVQALVEDLVPPNARARFWASQEQVQRMVQELAVRRVLAAQASAAGVADDPQAAAYLKVMREQALTVAYIKRELASAHQNEDALARYARSEYDANPAKFMTEPEVQVRHILLKVAPDGSDAEAVLARAQALREQLRAGADFARLAGEQSQDPGSAARGGALGWFGKGKMAPEFERAAFALTEPGALSEPVKTQFGYHIIELQARKPATQRPFEDVRDELVQKARERLAFEQRRVVWGEAEAQVRVDPAAVGALRVSNGAITPY